MKSSLTVLFLFLTFPLLFSQANEATMLFNWFDNTIPTTSWLGGRYNDCWGFEVNDREIAVMGSTAGVHFFDLTEGAAAFEIEDAFISGEADGANLLHRDYHEYAGYLYTVADEGLSTMQIIDITDLPTSTSLVYNDDALLRRAHNIFIDSTSARLYACGSTVGSTNHALTIISLDDPTNPVTLAQYPNFDFSIPYVHDAYIQGDTAYLNCGNSGFYVVDFTDYENPVLLGTMTDYEQQGYNHSGWLHSGGQYYYMADETHGRDLKVVDVSDFTDIHVVKTFNAESDHPSEIAHNLIVHEDKLYVSYYYDGLQVYDLSDPADPVRMAYYDTYDDPNDASYKGAWGVYPFFASGQVILSDMHNGLFLFEKIEDISTSTEMGPITEAGFSISPNPANNQITLALELDEAVEGVQVVLYDYTGRMVRNLTKINLVSGSNQIELSISTIPEGLYQVGLESSQGRNYQSLLISRR